ncbi:hypothetical protein K2173_004893 [Erythroxylum novogranatense]|uniref:Uncharacterized protein n=1 Tax=Erythroxylum novogranatense TaxID=1862640 RepID=A0AAV8UBK5_9ROSI|nr:hypothetical protein K2173_004893 [Erythroxylum novogranatense]
MNGQLLNLAGSQWGSEETRVTFFKCIRWQIEETLDPIDCPFHYYCDSIYPGSYPPYVDVLVLLSTTASYLAALVIVVLDIARGDRTCPSPSKKFLIPSGPVVLPIIILALAKGYRINTVFPLSSFGPAILQLLYVSALTFDCSVDKDIRYAFFEASTISGILHASLYLDAIILPYYTGLDAMVSSKYSGECESCVCREEPLVVGGRLVSYRGWSITTFMVVGTLCLRITCTMIGGKKGTVKLIKSLLESLSWILITLDCSYLLAKAPIERSIMGIAAFGGLLVLICINITKLASRKLIGWHREHEKSGT